MNTMLDVDSLWCSLRDVKISVYGLPELSGAAKSACKKIRFFCISGLYISSLFAHDWDKDTVIVPRLIQTYYAYV